MGRGAYVIKIVPTAIEAGMPCGTSADESTPQKIHGLLLEQQDCCSLNFSVKSKSAALL
jgi:hypothetical protein